MARVFLALAALCVAAQAVLASNEDRRDDRLHQDDYLVNEPAVLHVQTPVVASRTRPAVVASRPRPAVLAPRSRPAVIDSRPALYTPGHHIEDDQHLIHMNDQLHHYEATPVNHMQLVRPDDHFYVALPHQEHDDDYQPRRNERRRKNRKGSGSGSDSSSSSNSSEKKRRNNNRNNNNRQNRRIQRIQRVQRVQRPVLVSQPRLSQPLISQPLIHY